MPTHDRPSQKSVLITGASSGFGLLSAVAMAQKGLRVFATMRNLERRERLDAAAQKANVELNIRQLDVTQNESIAACVEQVENQSEGIDVLVNNAGYGLGGFFEDVTDNELRAQFDTNFFGLAAVTRAVLPKMRKRRQGRIVNLSSIAGRTAVPGLSTYVSSKWAVEGLSETLRLELRPFGIDVVLVEPGSYRTDIFDRNAQRAQKGQDELSPYYAASVRLEKLFNKIVDTRAGDPQEVAALITKIVMAKRPRLRYLVGKDAKMQAAARAWLPSAWVERAVGDFFAKLHKESKAHQ